jgi:FecR protein
MKTMNKTLTWLMAAVLSLTLVAPAGAETAAARTGKVVRIKGEARFSTGKKIWEPLKVGAILKPGSIVQTAKDSFVDIVVNEDDSAAAVVLKTPTSTSAPSSGGGAGAGGASTPAADQDVIRVLDDSYLVFDNMSAKGDATSRVTETLLDLKKGSIFGSVKKQAAASRFEVKIPNGVAGIRGTLFLISASGKVSCVTGSVVAAFTGSSGDVATEVVVSGYELNTNTGVKTALTAEAIDGINRIIQGTAYSSQSKDKKDKDKDKGHGHGNDGHVSKHKPSK